MEIINNLDFATPNVCTQSASDCDSIHPIRRDFDGSETPNVRYLPTMGPMELILYSSIVLMSISKL